MHTRDMMKTMIEAMSKQVHQIFAEQMKKEPAMTPQAEARVNKMMDDIIKSMPVDDLIDAMIPSTINISQKAISTIS